VAQFARGQSHRLCAFANTEPSLYRLAFKDHKERHYSDIRNLDSVCECVEVNQTGNRLPHGRAIARAALVPGSRGNLCDECDGTVHILEAIRMTESVEAASWSRATSATTIVSGTGHTVKPNPWAAAIPIATRKHALNLSRVLIERPFLKPGPAALQCRDGARWQCDWCGDGRATGSFQTSCVRSGRASLSRFVARMRSALGNMCSNRSAVISVLRNVSLRRKEQPLPKPGISALSRRIAGRCLMSSIAWRPCGQTVPDASLR